MFRRWSSATAALIAAAVSFMPATASAQFMLGGPAPYLGRPLYYPSYYISPAYRSQYLYYQTGLPYNPVVTNPFVYSDPVTPEVYNLNPAFAAGTPYFGGTYGAYAGAPLSTLGFGNSFSPLGYTGSYLPAFRSLGFASTFAPSGFGGYGGYGGFGSPMATAGFGGTPSLGYGSYVAPGDGYYSSYAASPFTYGGAAGYSPGFQAGLTSVPYTPGLNLNLIAARARIATFASFNVADPKTGGDVLLSINNPRMRSEMSPAVAVRPGSKLIKEALGGVDSDKTARISVVLPTANADVFFQGTKMKQTGATRQFESPVLAAGSYTYEIRATWLNSEGQPQSQTRNVRVRPGSQTRVDFTEK